MDCGNVFGRDVLGRGVFYGFHWAFFFCDRLYRRLFFFFWKVLKQQTRDYVAVPLVENCLRCYERRRKTITGDVEK
jgi:hypothetical protein